MPVAGEIIAFNDSLEDTPETVNEDPYGAGWMIKVKVSDPEALENLLDATAYTSLVTG
jgi:glycine cleavage system H protein